MKVIGREDEPQASGAVAATDYGDYRKQVIWVRSGADPGNWYPLGNEFGRPKVWDDNVPSHIWAASGKTLPQRPPGTVTLHPTWDDVLAWGPVTVLVPGGGGDYALGWRSGVRAARHKIVSELEWLEIGEPTSEETS
jgi:hypothetical protein